jgi:hypothetical protein
MLRPHRLMSLAGCAALIVAGCQETSSKITAYEPASPQAQQVIDRYLADVRGRYGALAISADGSRAAYHICLYRALTNCDALNHFNSSWTRSDRVAAERALSRCGGGCRLLYLNEKKTEL